MAIGSTCCEGQLDHVAGRWMAIGRSGRWRMFSQLVEGRSMASGRGGVAAPHPLRRHRSSTASTSAGEEGRAKETDDALRLISKARGRSGCVCEQLDSRVGGTR